MTTPEKAPLDTEAEKQSTEPRQYRRRWLMLAMFISLSMSNAFQWMEYAIIADIVQDFYSVPSTWVDWTSMIYMVPYIPFIFPAAFILDKYGLRVVALLGALGNSIGAWVKCASAQPHLSAVSFLGQAIVGTSQIFILNLPTRLAAVWFGPNEVSTACALGVFGNQLGIAFGFLVPPLLVPAVNTTTVEATGNGFRHLFFMSAGINSLIFLAILFFFKPRPPTAPSPAQQAAIEATVDQDFVHSLKMLLRNRNFILLIITYGMNVGVFYAVSTLLNQMLKPYYPDHGVQIGQIGLLIVIAGMVGSVIAGVWLDRTKRFKQTTFFVYVFSFVGMMIYTFTIDQRKLWVVFVVAGILGFFMTGYLPIGFEFGVEVTFPVSEGTVSGLLNMSCQVFGMLETLIMAAIMKKHGILASNLACSGVLLAGAIMTLFIKSDLRRQDAHRKSVYGKSESDKPLSIESEMVTIANGKPVTTSKMPHTESTIPILADTDTLGEVTPLNEKRPFTENPRASVERGVQTEGGAYMDANQSATAYNDVNQSPTAYKGINQSANNDDSIVDGHVLLADNVRLALDQSNQIEEIL